MRISACKSLWSILFSRTSAVSEEPSRLKTAKVQEEGSGSIKSMKVLVLPCSDLLKPPHLCYHVHRHVGDEFGNYTFLCVYSSAHNTDTFSVFCITSPEDDVL